MTLEPPSSPERAMRICVIDGDWLVTQTLREFIAELGHEVTVLPNVKHLCAMLEETPRAADLAIMDVCDNDAHGKERLRQLHTRFPELRVIAMLNHDCVLPTADSLANGIHAFLHRPVQLAELELMLVRLGEKRGNGNQPR